MLKKMLKYDLKSMFKIACPIYLALAAASVIGCGLLVLIFEIADNATDSVIMEFMMTSSVLFYIMILIMVSVVAALIAYLPAIHFYKHLFSDEGYLTLTLPITMSDHLLSKTLSAFVVNISSVAVGLASVFVALFLPIFIEMNMALSSSDVGVSGIEVVVELVKLIYREIGSATFAEYGIFMLISLFTSIMLLYVSITVGSVIFKRHKILGSILFYWVISMLFGVVQSGVGIIVSAILGASGANTFELASHISMIISIVIYAIFGVISYFVNLKLFNTRLNLE